MGLLEFLLVALYCGLFHTSVGQVYVQPQTSEEYEAVANALVRSLFGFGPCVDENCQSTLEATVTEQPSTPEKTKESLPSNELQEQIGTSVPTESQYSDFCKELEWIIKEIAAKDPKFEKVKSELLQKYKVHASRFLEEIKKTESTESVILKLLELLEFVIEKIKYDYVYKVPGDTIAVEEVHPEEEIIAEEPEVGYPIVGSVRGVPGVHYPNYTDVPITSFTCADQEYIPGFYADLETGCQVFHVCYEHRRESFLCPPGTIFNQPILACDYWYSSNCSLSSHYYDVNKKTIEDKSTDEIEHSTFEVEDFKELVKFLPVKAKFVEILVPKKEIPVSPQVETSEEVASEIFDQIVSTAAKGVIKAREVIHTIPEPVAEPIVKPLPIEPKLKAAIPVKKAIAKAAVAKASIPLVKAKVAAAAAIPIAKAKFAAAAVPVAKAAVASKVAVPVIAKAKLAVAAVPVVKAAKAIPVAKLAASSAAIPVAKAKIAIPVVKKAKLSGAAIPFVKAKLMKSAAIPLKGKIAALPLAKAKFALASTPLIKSKVAMKSVPLLKAAASKPVLAGIPIAKAKLAKAAMISPLTKKALALGYMKLLKAKKLHLMG